MTILRINHLQLAMPRGLESEARRFYGEVLELREIPKPPALAARGGVWFELGDAQLHLGVDADFPPAGSGRSRRTLGASGSSHEGFCRDPCASGATSGLSPCHFAHHRHYILGHVRYSTGRVQRQASGLASVSNHRYRGAVCSGHLTIVGARRDARAVPGGRSTSSLGGSLWRRTRFKNRWTRCWIHYALRGPRALDGLSGAPRSQ